MPTFQAASFQFGFQENRQRNPNPCQHFNTFSFSFRNNQIKQKRKEGILYTSATIYTTGSKRWKQTVKQMRQNQGPSPVCPSTEWIIDIPVVVLVVVFITHQFTQLDQKSGLYIYDQRRNKFPKQRHKTTNSKIEMGGKQQRRSISFKTFDSTGEERKKMTTNWAVCRVFFLFLPPDFYGPRPSNVSNILCIDKNKNKEK